MQSQAGSETKTWTSCLVVNVILNSVSLLSILTQCFSALNAASPRTQTFSQGPEASCLLQVEQQPEAELLPQEVIPGLCPDQGNTLCQVQMPHLQPG